MGDVAFVLLKGVVRKEKLAHLRFRVYVQLVCNADHWYAMLGRLLCGLEWLGGLLTRRDNRSAGLIRA